MASSGIIVTLYLADILYYTIFEDSWGIGDCNLHIVFKVIAKNEIHFMLSLIYNEAPELISEGCGYKRIKKI